LEREVTKEEHEILVWFNTRALIDAHKRGDDEAMRFHSQQKEKLKKHTFCADCYVPINPRSTRCLLHANKHRYWSRRLVEASRA